MKEVKPPQRRARMPSMVQPEMEMCVRWGRFALCSARRNVRRALKVLIGGAVMCMLVSFGKGGRLLL